MVYHVPNVSTEGVMKSEFSVQKCHLLLCAGNCKVFKIYTWFINSFLFIIFLDWMFLLEVLGLLKCTQSHLRGPSGRLRITLCSEPAGKAREN